MTNIISVTLENRLERLHAFKDLKKGWVDGTEGEALTETAYRNAVDFLHNLHIIKDDGAVVQLEMPAVFPMEDGGISFEWFNGRILTIEFEPNGNINLFSQTMDTRTTVDAENIGFDESLKQSREYLTTMFN